MEVLRCKTCNRVLDSAPELGVSSIEEAVRLVRMLQELGVKRIRCGVCGSTNLEIISVEQILNQPAGQKSTFRLGCIFFILFACLLPFWIFGSRVPMSRLAEDVEMTRQYLVVVLTAYCLWFVLVGGLFAYAQKHNGTPLATISAFLTVIVLVAPLGTCLIPADVMVRIAGVEDQAAGRRLASRNLPTTNPSTPHSDASGETDADASIASLPDLFEPPERLVAHLFSADAGIQNQAEQELIQLGEAAMPALLSLYRSPQSEQQSAATEVLRQMGPAASSVLPALIDDLDAPEAPRRDTAAQLLATLSSHIPRSDIRDIVKVQSGESSVSGKIRGIHWTLSRLLDDEQLPEAMLEELQQLTSTLMREHDAMAASDNSATYQETMALMAPSIAPVWVRQLESPDPGTQQRATRMLSQLSEFTDLPTDHLLDCLDVLTIELEQRPSVDVLQPIDGIAAQVADRSEQNDRRNAIFIRIARVLVPAQQSSTDPATTQRLSPIVSKVGSTIFSSDTLGPDAIEELVASEQLLLASPPLRQFALKHFVQATTPSPEMLEMVYNWALHNDKTVASDGRNGVRQLGPHLLPRIADRMQEAEEDYWQSSQGVRDMAVLGLIGTDSNLTMEQNLQFGKTELVAAGVKTLRKMKGGASARILANMVRQFEDPEHHHLRQAALSALVEGGPEGHQAMIDLLRTGHAVDDVVELLGTTNAEIVSPILEIIEGEPTYIGAGDARVLIQVSAIQVLEKLGPQANSAFDALYELAQYDPEADRRSPRYQMRPYAFQAIRRIDPARTLRGLLSKIESAGSASGTLDHRVSVAIRQIGDLGEDAASAVPALIQIVERGLPGYRDAAVSALGDIGPTAESALPALRQYMRTQPNSRAARSVIQRITGGQAGDSADSTDAPE